MNYQVWIRDEFGETYTKVDCGDLPAARMELDTTVRAGKEPLLTVEVPYSLSIKIEDVGTEKPKRKEAAKEPEPKVKEEPKSEADKSAASSD